MPNRVLLIEDEPLLADLVALNLRHHGIDVEHHATFETGRAAILAGAYDVALVDVMLPGGGDGFELTRLARGAGLKVPILLLTARSEVPARVQGLDAGADDYLTKPFHMDELLARVRALLRRAQSAGDTPRLALPPYWADLQSGLASTREGELVLAEKELGLLRLFVQREGQPLSRAEMLEEVWGMDAFPTDRTVDNFIVRLRRLFELEPEAPKRFLTVRGTGYLFRRG